MADFNMFNSLSEDLAEKRHNLGSDRLVVALTLNAPIATDSVLVDLDEISYSNLSSRDVTTISSYQTGGTYSLTIQDLVMVASGDVADFRYVVLYNNSSSDDRLIGWWDIGEVISLTNGLTYTVDFSAPIFTIHK